jgi:hypothetical protein
MESYDAEFGPEVQALLHEELSRLPDKYRIAVLVCDLEGRSRAEAAQRLGLPEGTVASRLARGRALLAKRLRRRGVGVSATSLAAMLPRQAALGSVPADLLANTLKVTALCAAGEATATGAVSGQVSTLTEAVLRAMAVAKQKIAGLVLLIAALVVCGGVVAHDSLANRPDEKVPPRDDGATRLRVGADPAAAAHGGPVLGVTAFYPGNSQQIAACAAAEIEKQLIGVDGIRRIESTSENNGRYTLRLFFKPNADPEPARKLVLRPVMQAHWVLCDVVVRDQFASAHGPTAFSSGMRLPHTDIYPAPTVKVEKAAVGPGEVAIAILDRGDNGWEALRKVASAVVKRLEAEDGLTRPHTFPGDGHELHLRVDRATCEPLGVTPADVFQAMQAAFPSDPVVVTGGMTLVDFKTVRTAGAAIERVREVVVRGKVSLGDIATIKVLPVAAAAYRVNLCPAIRITGTPPQGKSVTEAALQWSELADAEIKRLGSRGFAVENLSAK